MPPTDNFYVIVVSNELNCNGQLEFMAAWYLPIWAGIFFSRCETKKPIIFSPLALVNYRCWKTLSSNRLKCWKWTHSTLTHTYSSNWRHSSFQVCYNMWSHSYLFLLLVGKGLCFFSHLEKCFFSHLCLFCSNEGGSLLVLSRCHLLRR